MAEGTDLDNEAKNADETTNETEQIRERIAETRQEMGETINALEEKLSFQNISEQVTEQITEKAAEIYETAKDGVYDATIGKAGEIMKNVGREINKSGILDKATGNPLPLFLITLGAGLLFFGSNQKNNRTTANGGKNGRRSVSGGANDSSIIETTQSKIGGAANSVYDSVGDAADAATKKLGNLGSRARRQYNYQINANPLMIGAVALAAGAMVGLAIPSTEYEDELMGETRQNLVSKAQNAAQETVEKVKQVAGSAAASVSENVREKAEEVVENAVDSMRDEAKNQDLI